MIAKKYTGKICRVTFSLPPAIRAHSAMVCGDFYDWDCESGYMERQPDGGFALSLILQPGRQYRFHYVLDGERHMPDSSADGFSRNPQGGEDSILVI